MAIIETSARRLLIAGGFAIAVAATPAVATFTFTPAAPSAIACANGESTDIFNGECIPDLVPNSPEIPTGAVAGVNGMPSVDGIPCAGGSEGQCIGIAQDQQEEQVPLVPAHSSLNGQPLN
jgi:hypothetical protein